MKKIMVIISLFLTVGVFAQTKTNAYYDSGRVKVETKTQGAKATQITYFETGDIKEVGTFVNKKPYGIWKRYNKAGEVVAVGYFEGGKKTGRWFVRAEKSKVAYALYYENGKRIDAYALND